MQVEILLIFYFMCHIKFISYWTKWYTLQVVVFYHFPPHSKCYLNITLHNVVKVMYLHFRFPIIWVLKNLHWILICCSYLMQVFPKENWPLVKQSIFRACNMSSTLLHRWLYCSCFFLCVMLFYFVCVILFHFMDYRLCTKDLGKQLHR